MKRILTLLMLLMYSANIVGATVHVHYCMGKFAGWSLSRFEDDRCGRCGMKAKGKNECCKDVKKEIKLEKEHQRKSFQGIAFQLSLAEAVLPAAPRYLNPAFLLANHSGSTSYRPPPEIRQRELYILYCVYLI
ncbi:HYC_CC_PP family protein [Taibaiella koreensis]|uniref:HYC_CC_PP family protein n=1 Tax=Taibaiella koreensis TaxID=1268548 RepID=UPI0013C31F21|nr:hypothetical protein [Taibaiella koreensis]